MDAVLDDVAAATGGEVAVAGRLVGGINGGAVRVELAGGAPAVLKATPRTHGDKLGETQRARRVVEHMRECGYPTPAWFAVGATDRYVWHLMEFVDARPASTLTPSLIEQLVEIIELQAGQACVPYNHWSYAWRVATGSTQDVNETVEQVSLRRSIARLSAHSPEVSRLTERVRVLCAHVSPPPAAPDMVHADLSTPSNALVRDGSVVAVVDIGNAGSGTRAIDLIGLLWYTLQDPLLDVIRARLWTRTIDLVGWECASVLIGSKILHALEVAVRQGRRGPLPVSVVRGHRALDELNELR